MLRVNAKSLEVVHTHTHTHTHTVDLVKRSKEIKEDNKIRDGSIISKIE